MSSRKPTTEHLLLILASLTLLGVLALTAIQTVVAGYSLDVHLRENIYGIVFAAAVTLVCILEMVGWNWDRGYLDRIIEGLNSVLIKRRRNDGQAEMISEKDLMDFDEKIEVV